MATARSSRVVGESAPLARPPAAATTAAMSNRDISEGTTLPSEYLQGSFGFIRPAQSRRELSVLSLHRPAGGAALSDGALRRAPESALAIRRSQTLRSRRAGEVALSREAVTTWRSP